MAKATTAVTGIPELQADIAKMLAVVPSELERANARIGPRAVGRATPTPLEVGSGDGASPRVVVDRNTLSIEAGGPWRAQHEPQAAWGSQPGEPRTNPRPYLLAALEAELGHAEGEYLDAVLTAAAKIGWPVTQLTKT